MNDRNRFFRFLRNPRVACALVCLIGGGLATLLSVAPGPLAAERFTEKIMKQAAQASTSPAARVDAGPTGPAGGPLPPLNDPGWTGQGARADRSLRPFFYSDADRPVPGLWADRRNPGFHAAATEGRSVRVANPEELLLALHEAMPGDVIILAPGIYRIDRRTIALKRGGSPGKPIQVRAEKLGRVHLELNSLEGFLVSAPFWVFENLDIRGVCADDKDCEHAFHVVGDGRGFVLRNCRLHEFNAMIKANGLPLADGGRHFPDGALIEGNSFFNSRIRDTANPVTLIDVVGADDWIVRENLIADFAKGGGDRVSYAAFFKGNSSRGVFENNLVVCEYAHAGGTRVGLSLGGGGTGLEVSRGRDNAVEHTGGIVRNNIVVNCPDVALYLNKARDTQVWNNTFFNTRGIDVRFPASSAIVKNNLLDGRIRDREGGTSVRQNNLVLSDALFREGLQDIFADPAAGNFHLTKPSALIDKGTESPLVMFDFCNTPRSGAPDVGAIEYRDHVACQPFGMAAAEGL